MKSLRWFLFLPGAVVCFFVGEGNGQQPADDEVLEQVMAEMGQPVFKSSVESRTSEDRTYFAAFGGDSLHKITEGNVDLNPTLAGLGSFDFDDSTDIGPMLGLKVGRTFGRFSIGGESVPELDKVYF